jgi:uncharacterized RmlC-like cupin family protein
VKADIPRVIRANDRTVPETGQTPGMVREEALSSEGLWVGVVRTEPGMVSSWHHHGDNDTYLYVLTGRIGVDYGAKGGESQEARAGDFMVIPKRLVHRESGTEASEIVVVRVGQGKILFNVEGPED